MLFHRMLMNNDGQLNPGTIKTRTPVSMNQYIIMIICHLRNSGKVLYVISDLRL